MVRGAFCSLIMVLASLMSGTGVFSRVPVRLTDCLGVRAGQRTILLAGTNLRAYVFCLSWMICR